MFDTFVRFMEFIFFVNILKKNKNKLLKQSSVVLLYSICMYIKPVVSKVNQQNIKFIFNFQLW